MPQFPHQCKGDGFLALPAAALVSRQDGVGAATMVHAPPLSRAGGRPDLPSAPPGLWEPGPARLGPGVPASQHPHPHHPLAAPLRRRPISCRGEAPSPASPGSRGAGIPGQPHITVRAPSPRDPGPPGIGSLGLQGAPPRLPPSSCRPNRGDPGPQAGRGSARLLPAALTHRALWRRTFFGAVSPDPAGGRRFS
jgi:hypothetical protein